MLPPICPDCESVMREILCENYVPLSRTSRAVVSYRYECRQCGRTATKFEMFTSPRRLRRIGSIDRLFREGVENAAER